MAPQFQDRLLIPSHSFLLTIIGDHTLPIHIRSRKKMGIDASDLEIQMCIHY
jgi:hypothetical protein